MTSFTPKTLPSRTEFIALMAMLMAFVAFSIDAMLPAMGRIGADLSPADPLRAQLIVPIFIIGLGLGTFVIGPLADAYGRRPVVLGGAALYCVGALLAWASSSLEMLLAARLIQGIGCSGARVAATTIVRDCFSGREMARITSLVITIFTLIPAIAPTIGAGIIALAGWRGVFAAFMGFAILISTWFYLRQPETLKEDNRRPLHLGALRNAITEVLGHPLVVRAIAVQVLCFAMLFTILSVTQPIFETVLGAGHSFHLWFGATALLAISGPLLNARLVVRFGMYRIITLALTGEVILSLVYILALALGLVPQSAVIGFFLWQVTVFTIAGLTLGNLTAMALEPMGHIAGTATSLITAIATAASALLAIPAASLFSDSQIPIIWAILGFAALGRVILMSPVFTDPKARKA